MLPIEQGECFGNAEGICGLWTVMEKSGRNMLCSPDMLWSSVGTLSPLIGFLL